MNPFKGSARRIRFLVVLFMPCFGLQTRRGELLTQTSSE
jgi:hypothetical protein